MITNKEILAGRLEGLKIGDKAVTVEMLAEVLGGQEEHTLSSEKFHVLSDVAFNEMKTSIEDKIGKEKYDSGKLAGSEMTLKELNDIAALDSRVKDKTQFITELKKKFEKESSIEPNKKITELQESLNNLQSTLSSKDNEISTLKKKYDDFERSIETSEFISLNVPKMENLNTKQFTTLFKADGYDIEKAEDNTKFVTINGKPVKDAYEKYVPVTDVLTEYAKKNGWLTNSNGRGSGDDQGSKREFKTMIDVFKYMETNNINPNSREGKRLQDEFEAKSQA